MIVTVGVLGSTVESLPKELAELSYYVLDWTTETSNGEHGSGDREEDVEIEKYNYLEVPQTLVEMDNVSEVAIRYNASHKIGWKRNTEPPTSDEGLDDSKGYSALYINNGSGTPAAVKLQDIVDNIDDYFTDYGKGLLTFNYDLSDVDTNGDGQGDVYSPAYVFITIWLDVNGNGAHDADEKLTQDVKIVIYPAIYIVGDNSATQSIFINGCYGRGTNSSYLTIDGKQVGNAVGQDASTYMHVISISAFNEDNYMFAYNNNKNKDTKYIIGAPRVRSSNKLGVPDQNTTTHPQNATGWIRATDVNGTVRNLQYYYPTSTEANSYQVIAPKFRIASKLGGYSKSAPDGAALRCASYQEHGFPAGRWRLPTTAEMLYIVELQRLGKIQQLFYGNTTYFSATDRVKTDNNNNYTLQTGVGTAQCSVRCVYDEWYWGSKREAIENDTYPGDYQFTWGDREVY